MAIKGDAELVREAMDSQHQRYPNIELEIVDSVVTPVSTGGWLVFVVYSFDFPDLGRRTRWIVRPLRSGAASGASGEV